MPTRDLEKVLKEKIEPIIDSAFQKFLGITIKEISTDISDKLKKSPLLDFKIDPNTPFKLAKKIFKKEYMRRVLEKSYGNISAAAKLMNTDRRSIHRLVKECKINIDKIRKDMLKPTYLKGQEIKSIIHTTIDSYKDVLRPEKLEEVYKGTFHLTKNILKELPTETLTLKQAELEFERKYIKKALEKFKTVTKTAKAIGLRYETLIRKIKKIAGQTDDF